MRLENEQSFGDEDRRLLERKLCAPGVQESTDTRPRTSQGLPRCVQNCQWDDDSEQGLNLVAPVHGGR